MDGGGLLKVGGRNNKLKKRGENAPRPCIDRGEWRLGLQSRAGATKHRDSMQVGILLTCNAVGGVGCTMTFGVTLVLSCIALSAASRR